LYDITRSAFMIDVASMISDGLLISFEFARDEVNNDNFFLIDRARYDALS
jgi:hypothetical protein